MTLPKLVLSLTQPAKAFPLCLTHKGLSVIPPAWSCLDLTCYTDYLWTITCVLETRSPNPSILSLTW